MAHWQELFVKAPGTPDFVVGVNTAGDDVPGTGYWVKSGATGQVVKTDASFAVCMQWVIDTDNGGVYALTGAITLAQGLTADFSTLTKAFVIDASAAVITHTSDDVMLTLKLNHSGGTYNYERQVEWIGGHIIGNAGGSANCFKLDRFQHAKLSPRIVEGYSGGACVYISSDGTDCSEYNTLSSIESYNNKYYVNTDAGAGGMANFRDEYAVITLPDVAGARGYAVNQGIQRSTIINPVVHMGNAQANQIGISIGGAATGLTIVSPGFDLHSDTTAGKIAIQFGNVAGPVSIINPQWGITASYFQHLDDAYSVGRVTGGNESFVSATKEGQSVELPTVAGWTEVGFAGTGAKAYRLSDMYVTTGTNASSVAGVYGNIYGFGTTGTAYRVNWAKKIVVVFNIIRDGSDAQQSGYVKLSADTTVGDLGTKGIGIKTVNMALWGTSFGASGALVDLGVTLAHAATVMIINDPDSLRLEWWVDTGSGMVLRATQTTSAKIPQSEDSADSTFMFSTQNGVAGGTHCYISMSQMKICQAR